MRFQEEIWIFSLIYLEMTCSWEKSSNVQKTFRLTQLTSQFGWLLQLFGREKTKIQIFITSSWKCKKSPLMFLNLRYLYPLLYLNFTLMCETLSWRLLEFNNFLHFFNLFATSEPPKYSNSNSTNLLLWFFCLIKSRVNHSWIMQPFLCMGVQFKA